MSAGSTGCEPGVGIWAFLKQGYMNHICTVNCRSVIWCHDEAFFLLCGEVLWKGKAKGA